ncbi:hypothetical protein J1614_011676 [Plenodomus biglobosus]|nr:hypothetical protein J1614_011676 [Plenodomus biglobosus]
MPESSSPDTQAINNPSTTSSSKLSLNTMTAEPHPYRRYVADFSSRFANALNRRDSQVTHAPAPPVATAGSADRTQIRGTSTIFDNSNKPLIFAQGLAAHEVVTAPVAGRLGSEKGGYRNTCDYIKRNFCLGDQNASAGSSSSSGRYFVPHARAPAQYSTTSLGLLNAQPSTRVMASPEDAEDRRVLLGPLRIVYRHCCIKEPDDHDCGTHSAILHPNFLHFLDTRMSGEFQTVIQRNAFIPTVVYVVAIKMTEIDWRRYNILLAEIPEALELQKKLEVDPEEFDEFTGSSERTESQVETYQFMARCRLNGQDLEETAKLLVEHFGPMWKISRSYAA